MVSTKRKMIANPIIELTEVNPTRSHDPRRGWGGVGVWGGEGLWVNGRALPVVFGATRRRIHVEVVVAVVLVVVVVVLFFFVFFVFVVVLFFFFFVVVVEVLVGSFSIPV